MVSFIQEGSPTSAGVISPMINAGDGTVRLPFGRFVLTTTDAIADATTLDLTARDGSFPPFLDLNGRSEAFAGLTGSGNVDNTGFDAATLTLGGTGASSTFTGRVLNSGSGRLSLVKTGAGALTLAGTVEIDGTASVNDGRLVINNRVSGTFSRQMAVVATGAGWLMGTGAINGSVQVVGGGTIQPGAVSGPGSVTNGSLDLETVSVAFQSDSRLAIRVNRQGSTNLADRLSVTGAVAIDPGAELVVSPGATSIPINTVITIISNDDSDPVIGTFRSLPEGATVAAAGQRFRISYRGGDGNDVTLTAVPDPPTATLSAPAVTAAFRPAPYQFTVTYEDVSGINAARFASGNVTVTTPSRVAAVAVSFVSATPAGNGSPRTATYQFTPRAGVGTPPTTAPIPSESARRRWPIPRATP